MADAKIRVFISWLFLLLVWPAAILISVSSPQSGGWHFIFSASGPFFAMVFRQKYSKLDRIVKQYALSLLIISGLTTHAIKSNNFFIAYRQSLLILITAIIIPTLAWYIYDDTMLILKSKNDPRIYDVIQGEEIGKRKKTIVLWILLIITLVAACAFVFLRR